MAARTGRSTDPPEALARLAAMGIKVVLLPNGMLRGLPHQPDGGEFGRLTQAGAQETVVQGNLNVARQVSEQIDLYVTGSVKILKAVAADLQQTALAPWQQDRILKNYVLEFPEFRELTLVDENGRPTISSRLGKPSVTVPSAEPFASRHRVTRRLTTCQRTSPGPTRRGI